MASVRMLPLVCGRGRRTDAHLVFGVGVILLVLALGVIVEGVLALRRDVKARRA